MRVYGPLTNNDNGFTVTQSALLQCVRKKRGNIRPSFLNVFSLLSNPDLLKDIMTFYLVEIQRTKEIRSHMTSSHLTPSSSTGGLSGTKTQSAPTAMAAIKANQPQCRPITSTTKAR